MKSGACVVSILCFAFCVRDRRQTESFFLAVRPFFSPTKKKKRGFRVTVFLRLAKAKRRLPSPPPLFSHLSRKRIQCGRIYVRIRIENTSRELRLCCRTRNFAEFSAL